MHPPPGNSCSCWFASLCVLAATVGAAAFVSIAAPSRTAPWTRAAHRPSTLAARDSISDAARLLIEPLCVDDHLAPSVFLVGVGGCGESSLRDDVATHLRAIRPMPGASRENAPGYFDADDHDQNPTRWSRWLTSNADECAAVAADVDAIAAAADVDVADAARIAPRAHLHAHPAYWRLGTARRIRDAYPDPSQRDALRFIVTVCDPEERLRRAFAEDATTKRDEKTKPKTTNRGDDSGRFGSFEAWLDDAAEGFEAASAPGGVLDTWAERSASGKIDERDARRFEPVVASRYDVALAEYVAAFGADRVLVASSERHRRDPAGTLRDIAEHVNSATRGLDRKTKDTSSDTATSAEPERSERFGRAEAGTARRRVVLDALREGAANARDMGCPVGTRGPGGGEGMGLKLAGWDASSREERAMDWGFVPEKSREGDCVPVADGAAEADDASGKSADARGRGGDSKARAKQGRSGSGSR